MRCLLSLDDWVRPPFCRQFQKLNAQKDIIEVKVIRGGQQLTIPNTDVVVGDVMLLDTGDKIVADGYTIEVSVCVCVWRRGWGQRAGHSLAACCWCVFAGAASLGASLATGGASAPRPSPVPSDAPRCLAAQRLWRPQPDRCCLCLSLLSTGRCMG